MLEIQKGVPVWPTLRKATTTIKRRKYPLEDMEVGDFLFYPERLDNGVSSYICRASKKMPGYKFVTKFGYAKQVKGQWTAAGEGTRGAQPGIGVWRVE